MTMIKQGKLGPNTSFFLSELLGKRVYAAQAGKPKKLGKVKDFIIIEAEPLAHVAHCLVKRGFGLPDLIFPIELISTITMAGLTLNLAGAVESYATPRAETALLLADYVLDKKVIDLEGREISMVFDVQLLWVENLKKMYVTDVEFGHKGLYRRLGLKWLANRFQDDLVSWTYIQALPDSIGSFQGDVRLKEVKENLADMPPVDLADIIEELDADQRTEVFLQLDEESASDTLEELEPHVQRQLVAELEPDVVARLINQMTPPQAADLLAILPYEDKQAIFGRLEAELSQKIQAILEKQEESILHYATDRYISLPESTLVGYVEDNYAQLAREMDITMYIFALDGEGKLSGVMDIKEILLADNALSLAQAMNTSVVSLEPGNTLREAYQAFERYGYRALPIVDSDHQLQGVLRYRDVMNLKHRFVA